MRSTRKSAKTLSRVLYLVVLTILILYTHSFFSRAVSGQGWQMYIDEIKQGAASRRLQKKSSTDQPTSATGLKSENSSTPETTPLPQRDFAGGSNPQAENTPAPADKPQSKPINGTRRMLDFSGLLGEKPQQWSPDEMTLREDSRREVPRAAAIPSCRNFPEMRNDATLNDVYFCDPRVGWAVGDRGTIWHTSDGGAQWNMIETNVEANFYSVHFVDNQFGFIVGGELLPGVPNGRGIVLRTVDGGVKWTQVTTVAFPILRKVRFIDRQRGWLGGDSSELYPGGIFASEDGGESFLPVSGNRHAGWKCLEFNMDSGIGIGLGTDGSVQRANRSKRAAIPLPLGNRRLCDLVRVRDDDPIRAAGEGGIITESRDGGEHWLQLSSTLPQGTLECFDFLAIFAGGEKIFTAGSPGTFIFSSEDGGKTWRRTATGSQVPIRRITFTDSMHGWCVGDLGTILSTTNGGLSWQVQRSGGSRLAALGFFGSGSRIPYEAFVRLSGEEGYLARAQLAVREEQRERKTDEMPWIMRVNEAMLATGACGAGECALFMLNSSELQTSIKDIIARFDQENDSKGLERFREHLVRQIRLWRPSILLVDDPEASPFSELLDRELPTAIRSAADPLAWPELATVAGLNPWSISRVFRYSKEKTGNIRIESGKFCPTLGRDTGEVSGIARSLLGLESGKVALKSNFVLLFDAKKKAGQGAGTPIVSFFQDIHEPYGSDCRRVRQKGLSDRRDELDRREAARRHRLGIINRFAAKEDKNRLTGEILIGQIRQITEGADPDQALEHLLTLGRRFNEQGNWSAAEEIYSMAALEFPTHPQVREALVWLVQYYAGSEPHWRGQARNRWSSSEGIPTGPGGGSTRTRLALDTTQTNSRFRNAGELGKMIRQLHPELYMTPEVRFPLAMMQRKRGQSRNALQYYLNRSLLSKDDLWGIRARAEYWLMAPNKEALPEGECLCPLLTMSCRATSTKPFLDGILEPDVWDAAMPVSLSVLPLVEGPAKENSTEDANARDWQQENRKRSKELGTFVSLLYDNEYLYIGIVGKKSSAFDYKTDESPRKRDVDMTTSDRVELEFDLDRDYTSTWKFVFDWRGNVADAAWNDASWNPTVFVASQSDQERWTLEIAIPLEELCERPPSRADVWLVSAKRTIPGDGCECWNSENSERSDSGFGFLTFGF